MSNQTSTQAQELSESVIENLASVEEEILGRKRPALMKNIEVMLREQLRQLIQNEVPAEELQQHMDKINNDLDKAEGLLVGAAP
jgi:hypothetical protein